MNGPDVDRCDATLGAVVTGVDLADLDESSWRLVEDAFHEHGVLIFPAQHLSAGDQAAFGRRFGELEAGLHQGRDVVSLSNRGSDGVVRGTAHPSTWVLRGNEGWHTDSSYMPVSSKASVLSAEVVPDAGGQTEWADMRAALDALSSGVRDRISDLAAHHSLKFSQTKAGFEPHRGYGMDTDSVPLRPLVKTHPVTGRDSLFIGRHAHAIPSLSAEESAELLDGLVESACREPRILSHAWQPGDVVVWDNRCLLHRARPYDYSQARVMRHTRVAGDPASERAIALT